MLTRRCPTCARTFAAAQRFCPSDGAELAESWSGDPRAGTIVLGRYRIEARLGQGGMGVVYRAEQDSVGRNVAVKLVRSDRIGDVAAVRRFLREVQTMARLQSPHTVKLIDAGTTDEGEPCLVMELLVGETLRERLDRGPVPWREALTILEGVTCAIAEAHECGLLHRDIKPSNVFLVTTPGYPVFPKVLDFGIASSRATIAGFEGITGSDEVPGTPVYLAPERITGDSAGAAADVYALGVLGYELVAGRPPFVEERPHELLLAHLEHDPPSLARFVPDVPPALEVLLRTCLAKTPSERPGDATVLLPRLAALAREVPYTPHTPTTLRTTGTDPWSRPTDRVARVADVVVPPPRRSRTPMIAGAAVIIGAGAVLAAQALVPSPRPAPPTAAIEARALRSIDVRPVAPTLTPAEPVVAPVIALDEAPTATPPASRSTRLRRVVSEPAPRDELVDKLLGD